MMVRLIWKIENGRVIGIAGNANPLSWSGISFDVPAPLLSIVEGSMSRVQFKLMSCKQISRMEFLNLKNTWVWFLKVSLKIHADVIAGRQFNQTVNEIMRNFMNKYVNSPSFNWLANSYNISHVVHYCK